MKLNLTDPSTFYTIVDSLGFTPEERILVLSESDTGTLVDVDDDLYAMFSDLQGTLFEVVEGDDGDEDDWEKLFEPDEEDDWDIPRDPEPTPDPGGGSGDPFIVPNPGPLPQVTQIPTRYLGD